LGAISIVEKTHLGLTSTTEDHLLVENIIVISIVISSIVNTPPAPPKGGKCEKIVPHVQRAGGEIGKVLQRYLFTLSTDDEKLQYMLTTYRSLFPLPSQMTAFVKLWRYPCPTDPPELFHSFGESEGGGEVPMYIKSS